MSEKQQNPDLPLPNNWCWTKIGEIVRPVKKINPQDIPEWEFDYIDIASIDNSKNTITQPKKYQGLNAPSRARQVIKKGDVILSTVRTYLKNIARVDTIYDGQIASTGFCVLRPYKEVNSKFLFHYVLTDQFLNPLNSIQRGTSYPAVRDTDVFDQFMPLPPLPEQHRIVAKIEELFTQLDAGVAALTTALAQLKRYRQSVLKAAFEGKLTGEWRERHADNKAIKIATKIIADNDHIQGLSKIPENWVWSNIGKISHLIQYGTSEKASEDSNGIPILRMGNIQDGKLIFEGLKYLPSDFPDLEKYKLQDGDVLFNRTNSAELVGKSAVYKEKHPASVFASYLIRVRSNADLCQPDLLSYFINSPFGKIYIKSVVSQQVGQANVNGTKLANMPIPLPPLTEQHEIVAEIERRFTIIDEMEKTIQQSLTQAERLRQSILKRAFEGKLVPQDPNDEPASLLLERIKKEKGTDKTQKKTKRSGKSKTTQQELI